MHAAYFETRFAVEAIPPEWPAAFAIITAYATTGEAWSTEENRAADTRLENVLAARGVWHQRVTGYSPHTGHAEPGWAAALGFDAACDLGQRFRQDAIYYIEGDGLFVSHCDARRARLRVGPFRERVDNKNILPPGE